MSKKENILSEPCLLRRFKRLWAVHVKIDSEGRRRACVQDTQQQPSPT